MVLLGADIEQLMNYDEMHDWLVQYCCGPHAIHNLYYIADLVDVEYALKANLNTPSSS